MPVENRSRKLVLYLTDQEWAAIEGAAKRGGFDEVEMPTFVRRVLLEILQARGEKPSQEKTPTTQETPAAARAAPAGKPRKSPKCGCGMTRNADGSCDLSCIMRL